MSDNINKKDFLDLMHKKMNQSDINVKLHKKDLEILIQQFFETCKDSLKANKRIFFSGFGAFSVRKREATVKTNPKDPSKKVKVPAKKVARFKPSDKLNDSLN